MDEVGRYMLVKCCTVDDHELN